MKVSYFNDLFEEIKGFFTSIDYIRLTINIFTFILGTIVIYLITRIIYFLLNRISALSIRHQTPRSVQRLKTINRLISSALNYAFYIITLIYLLTFFNISASTMITGVGAVGLIVTFAFQDLIKDIVAGVFVIIENSYDVGDTVILNDITGKVANITLRSTSITTALGESHTFRNASVNIITNYSKSEFAIAKTVLVIANEENDQEVIGLLNEQLPGFAKNVSEISSAYVRGVVWKERRGIAIEIRCDVGVTQMAAAKLKVNTFLLEFGRKNQIKIIKIT